MSILKFSKVGFFHLTNNRENQDYLADLETKDYLLIIVADGATSCQKGLQGAKITCEAIKDGVLKEGSSLFRYSKEKLSYLLIEHIYFYLENKRDNDYAIDDYGCTFSFMLMEKKTGKAMIVSLGDCACFLIKKGYIHCVQVPKRFRNNPCLTTTKGSLRAIEVNSIDVEIGDEILLCSDGFLPVINEKNIAYYLKLQKNNQLNNHLSHLNIEDDCSYISYIREKQQIGEKKGKKMYQKSKRNYLTDTITLSRNTDGSLPEKYKIKSVIGEGGSSICYEAIRIRKDGVEETGKLKEFYPIDSVFGSLPYYSLIRLRDGQLVPGAGTIRKFDDMCQDYLDSYRLLYQVMKDNPNNEILKGYIQHGEILYGHLSAETSYLNEKEDININRLKSTVYIWSPGLPGKTFDDYLNGIKNNPTKNPEKTLQDILSIINAITDCTKALHTAGLLHMDIKPSNFLVQYDSDYKIRPNSISLFDINTLCSVRSPYMREVGSKGFCAPEVLIGKADNCSDIYSIGAMLFYAIISSESIQDGLYQDSLYSNIDQLIKHSVLFQGSEINSDARLMSLLSRILKNCLAKNPEKRYQACSYLKSDLEKAILRLTKLIFTPVDKKLSGLCEPTIVIQKLLYEHPLYESIRAETNKINVLVLGSGNYSQKFIDEALQAGQMSNISLNIDTISEEPEENKDDYLRFRPALTEYVNIDGSLNENDELAYGSVTFIGVSDFYDDENACFHRITTNVVQPILSDALNKGKKYDYVFISLGDDNLNKKLAQEFAKESEYPCPIAYVSQHKISRKFPKINNVYPVYINEPLNLETIDPKLGEMAFNTHISWKGSFDEEERKRFFFEDSIEYKYNRKSSVAFALSLKYKLHSIQIDCPSLDEAANIFAKEVLELLPGDQEAKKKFDRMVDLEHRRWLIDRAVDGWTAPKDSQGNLRLKDCINRSSVKDSKNRTHPCMVRGSETSPLKDYDHKMWDEGVIDPHLDELDRMSIELHRIFKNYAQHFHAEGEINQDLDIIQDLIPPNAAEISIAFKNFRFAIKNICDGVEGYSRQYNFYKNSFKSSYKDLASDEKNKIEGRLKLIDHALFPVIESNLYRNYKAYDEVLIKQIPYIISNTYKPTMAIGLLDRDETAFTNVTAASVLCPQNIKYFYCLDDSTNTDLLLKRIAAIVEYMRKRNMNTTIELVLAYLKDNTENNSLSLNQSLSELNNKYGEPKEKASLKSITVYHVDSYQEATNLFADYLKNNPVDLFCGDNPIFPTEKDNTTFVSRLIDSNIPYFKYDWKNNQFIEREHCEYLKYVNNPTFIRIRDLFALMNNSSDAKYDQPEFSEDYEALWDIYSGKCMENASFKESVANWNTLQSCLKQIDDARKPLAIFQLSADDETACVKEIFKLPKETLATVKSVVEKLIQCHVLEKDSNVVMHNSDSYKLEILTKDHYLPAIKQLFGKQKYLYPYYRLNVSTKKTDGMSFIIVNYDTLEVEDVRLSISNPDMEKTLHSLLEKLEEKHLISQLQIDCTDPSVVSFYYSSLRIKKILTTPGELLKIHTYYDIVKTGYFDDVISGYGYDFSNKSGVSKEIDLIAIKGFRSILINCNTLASKTDDYQNVANKLGNSTVIVQLAAIQSDSITSTGQTKIITLSKEEDIINVGQILVNLMKADLK